MNLIHPISIVVEPIDKASTIYDADAREPIQIVKRKQTITIPAQVEYREFATHGSLSHFTAGGLQVGELGYVAIRTVDYLAASWTPAMGDKLTQLGVATLDDRNIAVYVVRIKPFGHYPVVGYLGLKLYFSDRKPDRN